MTIKNKSKIQKAKVLLVSKTTTAHQARLQIFQPTRRPQFIERIINTPYGEARIKGKLGQQHADFIEAIFYYREDLKILDDGRILILVDPYKIRISMGAGKDYSYSGIKNIADDVMSAIIDLKIKLKNIEIIGHIIEKIEKSTILKDNPLNKKAKRAMWVITIADTYAKLMANDLQLYYNPTPIAKIDTGIAQAVTRWCLGQKDTPNGGWILDNLIEAVGGINKNSDPHAIRDRRIEVRKDAKNMKNCGVILENDRIFLLK